MQQNSKIIHYLTLSIFFRNPTSSRSEFVNTNWPVSNINNTYVSCMNIDVNMTVIINPDNRAMKFWDLLYKKFGSGVYNSYK